MKPLIAITVRAFNQGASDRYFTNEYYITKLQNAGCTCMMIPPDAEKDAVHRILSLCDGLLVPGGKDVDPACYHATSGPFTEPVEKNIEDLDICAIEYARDHNMPVLGICRGIQIINVVYGGTLIQDIPSETHTAVIHNQSLPKHEPVHTVQIFDFDFQCLFGNVLQVNSFHHQAIKDLADGFTVVAKSEDGIIEAIRNNTILATQWHPELMKTRESDQIFEYWVKNYVTR
ncbi:MAG: type 1 glutamine amidotransferase [Erysipelotrichaceae bacterium]|nr:type 1 glutamine amidotransferase [Erysipelotrichaceae bacterium]